MECVNEKKLLFLMVFFLWLIHFVSYNYFSPESIGVFLLPILFALSLRSIFSPLFSYHIVLVLVFCLTEINEVKYYFSQKALGARDFVYVSQAMQVRDYLPLKSLILISLAVLSLLIPYRKYKKLQLNFLWWPVLAFLIYGHVSYGLNDDFLQSTNATLAKYGNIHFNVLSLRDNIKSNGILLHLAQTLGLRSTPPAKGPHQFYAGTTPTKMKNSIQGYDIFLVVCESCYFQADQKSEFYNDLHQLIDEDYRLAHVISPVYGGGTSEAEFELITGLPSKVLPGIKFQLYADVLSDEAESFAGFLDGLGYKSYYFHNSHKRNWRRIEVIKKFKYQEAYFLEDMDGDDVSRWARDSVLYNKVLQQYRESIKSSAPVFNQLMTVYTHGSYQDSDGDGGVRDYNNRLRVSVGDYLEFEREITRLAKESGRRVMFVVVGDHKPSIGKAFYEKDISSNYYLFGMESPQKEDYRFKDSLDPEGLVEIGRVPLFIKTVGAGDKVASELQKWIDDKPMFCFPGYVGSLVDSTRSLFLSKIRNICDQHPARVLTDPQWLRATFPSELYAELLF